MNKVKYKHNNKHNTDYKQVTKAVCNFCLEDSTFRIISVEMPHPQTGELQPQNRLACTRCLKSVRFNKHLKPIQHGIIKVTHFNTEEKINRFFKRVKRYFTGDHVYLYFPYKRKRTK